MRLLRTTALLSTVLATALLIACTDDPDDEPSPTGTTPEVPATATTAPPPTATATSTPIPGLTPAAGATPATLVLDPAPKQTPVVTQKTLGAFTPSTLAVPDRMDTVVYEVATNTATNLGPGTIGQFSPDGKLMVWSTLAGNNPTEVYLYDLITQQKRALALGRDPRFMGNDKVVFVTGASNRTVIDLASGQQTPLAADVQFPDFSVVDLAGGTYRLRTLPTQPNALTNHLSYAVEEIASGKPVLRFDATQAQPAGVNEVLAATVSAAQATNPTMNLYLFDVKTGASTYVTSALWSVNNFPMSATSDLVAWTEAYCNFSAPGKTRIYDRKVKTITELDRSFWVKLTPDGKIAPGEFGGKSLIDLTTLRATFVIPGTEAFDRNRDVNWTADYKFASTGFAGGHGGLCG